MNNVVGYEACNSGLNNQKHCLLGLLAHARGSSADIALPMLVNFATDDRGAVSKIPFEEIFDAQRLINMARLAGVEVREGEMVDNVNFHQMFQMGGRVSGERSDASRILSQSFWRNLRPSLAIERRIDELAGTLFGELGVQAVLQLRIESDWQKYANTYMKPVEGEDPTTSYRAILSKVAKTMGTSIGKIYVTCDETQVPLDEVNRFAEEVLNLQLVWKSDLVMDAISPGDFCLKTTIDFELALRSKIFVGTTRSTFANTVCMTKVALEGDRIVEHYIYNVPGELLARRRDGGIYADYRDAIR